MGDDKKWGCVFLVVFWVGFLCGFGWVVGVFFKGFWGIFWSDFCYLVFVND